ncbi:MAG: hypothetical protein JOZ69_17205, partial [Myxococcales bacterium]|nr:hypothetical protein [Myxococcales bacterium]
MATTDRHGTLPPPEWSTPRSDGRRHGAGEARSLLRRTGARAEEGWHRARVDEARAAGDPQATRAALVALARWLASRDRDLDEAVELAAEALRIADDVELRREMSAWLESLGEPARAAAVLKPVASLGDLEPSEATYVLLRTGLLKARAGGAAAAAAAFEGALSIEPSDPAPAELLGALCAWPPDTPSAETAVAAYLEAARRRAAQGQHDLELEDLWRAFTAGPASETAAGALAAALERRGRGGAADEVLRSHARAKAPLDEHAELRVHARRRAAAGEVLGALAAALDERLDTRVGEADGGPFDAILLDAGMLDLLAARLEHRAATSLDPEERAARYVVLARLCAGPLDDAGRARRAYAAALAADRSCPEALAATRAARRGDGGGAEADGHDEEDADRERGAAGRSAAAALWMRAVVAGDDRGQAAALERAADFEGPALRALLLSVGAERLLEAGDLAGAERDAELATQADPTSAHALATLAGVAAAACAERLGPGDAVEPRSGVGRAEGVRRLAVALERAIGVVGPRLTWCSALADALESGGDAELAAGWTQRCLALRPCDRPATERLLSRLVRARDPSRLRDALSGLLGQPQPVAWAAEPFARALAELGALDPERAAVVARRALDVFGPKSPPLRDAMLGVAERAGDRGFAVAVLERALASGDEALERRALLLRLLSLREGLGDGEGVARAAARAIREGIEAPEIDRWLEEPADSAETPDAVLLRLRAIAERRGHGGAAEAREARGVHGIAGAAGAG